MIYKYFWIENGFLTRVLLTYKFVNRISGRAESYWYISKRLLYKESTYKTLIGVV